MVVSYTSITEPNSFGFISLFLSRSPNFQEYSKKIDNDLIWLIGLEFFISRVIFLMALVLTNFDIDQTSPTVAATMKKTAIEHR